jgi:DNA-binding transcriptional LysR family regulator
MRYRRGWTGRNRDYLNRNVRGIRYVVRSRYTPTFDQLRVFLAVVDVGSFAGAARKLHRATSVISYSIGNLESQLGVSLFDRESTRKPQLTEAGRTVLSEARGVTNGINGLRARVRSMLQGLEAEIHLVLDVMFPACRIVDALKAFRAEFPTVSLSLHMEALGAVTQMVLDRKATIGICGPLDVELPGLERVGVGSVELIPVAAPDHPLSLAGRNPPGAGRDHIQLVLTDRSPLADGHDRGVIGTQRPGASAISARSTCCCGKALAGVICPSRWCARISNGGGSRNSTCASTRMASFDCMPSIGRIHRQVPRAPGSFRGSRRRLQARPNLLVNAQLVLP